MISEQDFVSGKFNIFGELNTPEEADKQARFIAAGGLNLTPAKIPTVTFSLQQHLKNFPDEVAELVDVTPELQMWAEANLSAMRLAFQMATDAQRAALSVARGEGSWRDVGGPDISCRHDELHLVCIYLQALAQGSANAGSSGWIDRREWAKICRVVSA